MSAAAINSFATQTAIASLNLYQRHLSPRKGFSCPHRLLHGKDSCSDYVKQILLTQDLWAALRLAPTRFKDCKAAAQVLQGSGGCIVIPCCIPL